MYGKYVRDNEDRGVQRPLLRSTPLMAYRHHCTVYSVYHDSCFRNVKIKKKPADPLVGFLNEPPRLPMKVSEAEMSRSNYVRASWRTVRALDKTVDERIPSVCSVDVEECQTGWVEVCSYNSAALSAICLQSLGFALPKGKRLPSTNICQRSRQGYLAASFGPKRV